MCFRCVLEQIYCKFTVCILFDIFFQKVSDIFKKETYHFPFTKHKPIISFPYFSRCGPPVARARAVVASPVWSPRCDHRRMG